MSRNRPDLVPASLQRVRCFLGNSGRMKVKPWADTGETLDAFHDALLTRRDDERFWQDLQSLLEACFAFEKEVVQLYADAAAHGARIGSHDDRVFFQALFAEEQEHAQELLQWMQELNRPSAAGMSRRAHG